MSVIVRLIPVLGTTSDGYLLSFDVEAYSGRGEVRLTADRAKARRFADAGEAFTLWHSVPKCRPRRPDGKPNKPLTAYHMLTEPFEEGA